MPHSSSFISWHTSSPNRPIELPVPSYVMWQQFRSIPLHGQGWDRLKKTGLIAIIGLFPSNLHLLFCSRKPLCRHIRLLALPCPTQLDWWWHPNALRFRPNTVVKIQLYDIWHFTLNKTYAEFIIPLCASALCHQFGVETVGSSASALMVPYFLGNNGNQGNRQTHAGKWGV